MARQWSGTTTAVSGPGRVRNLVRRALHPRYLKSSVKVYGYVRTTNGAGGQRFVHAMNIAGKCALTQVSLTVYLKFCEIQSLVRLVCIKEV